MKHILKILLLYFVIEVNCSKDSFALQSMDFTLINDYLQANNLKTCVVLSCNKNHASSQLLNTDTTWYNFYDITNESIEFEMLLRRLSHQIAVVIDLDCSDIEQFLREISKRMYFHHERYWFMFSPDVNRTFDSLDKQNINVDAEVSIAVPIEDSGRK